MESSSHIYIYIRRYVCMDISLHNAIFSSFQRSLQRAINLNKERGKVNQKFPHTNPLPPAPTITQLKNTVIYNIFHVIIYLNVNKSYN